MVARLLPKALGPLLTRSLGPSGPLGLLSPFGAVVYGLVGWGLRRRSNLFVALVWRLAMHRYATFSSRRWGRKKLVVLERQGGREDVESAFYDAPANYQVLFLPRLVLKASAHFFLGDRITDVNYLFETADLEREKDAYRDHLLGVLLWFKTLFGLSAILEFNVVYYAERELALACRQLDLRFVCLQKEATWSPLLLESQDQYLREVVGSYWGDAIAFYNSTSMSIHKSAGLVPEGRGYVVGCPRLDESHRLRCEQRSSSQMRVVFFLIQNRGGLPEVPDSRLLRQNWSSMIAKVNRAILELASENPQVQFILKSKGGHEEQQLKALFSALSSPSLPPNVELHNGGSGHRLLTDASVVIGFNSTAVLEAIAAGIPTVVPHIFSKDEKRYAGGAHLVGEGAQIADTVESLKNHILSALRDKANLTELGTGQKTVLQRYLGNVDGRSGERLRDFLDQAVSGTFRSATE